MFLARLDPVGNEDKNTRPLGIDPKTWKKTIIATKHRLIDLGQLEMQSNTKDSSKVGLPCLKSTSKLPGM